MNKKPLKIAVLIVAGGNGSRMDNDLPKQYIVVNGLPILRHTLNQFINFGNFCTIQCVIGHGHETFYQQAVNNITLSPPVLG